jgi:hypothetical protein
MCLTVLSVVSVTRISCIFIFYTNFVSCLYIPVSDWGGMPTIGRGLSRRAEGQGRGHAKVDRNLSLNAPTSTLGYLLRRLRRHAGIFRKLHQGPWPYRTVSCLGQDQGRQPGRLNREEEQAGLTGVVLSLPAPRFLSRKKHQSLPSWRHRHTSSSSSHLMTKTMTHHVLASSASTNCRRVRAISGIISIELQFSIKCNPLCRTSINLCTVFRKCKGTPLNLGQ